MSLSNVLDDPLINELLDSGTSRYALLGHVNEELSLIAASKLFRQELGFKSGSELIVNRYGMAIYRALSNALHRQQGWTGHVKVNSQWLRLQMLAHGEFGVIQEHDAKKHPTVHTRRVCGQYTGTTLRFLRQHRQKNSQQCVAKCR